MGLLETLFNNVLNWWWDENAHVSSPIHRSYSSITLNMFGDSVRDLAFKKLKEDSRYWGVLLNYLQNLYGDAPNIPDNEAGYIDKVIKRWLEWADKLPDDPPPQADIKSIISNLNRHAKAHKAAKQLSEIYDLRVDASYELDKDYYLMIYPSNDVNDIIDPIQDFMGFSVKTYNRFVRRISKIY